MAQVRVRVLNCVESDKKRIAQAVDEILRGALLVDASDVHFTPHGQQLEVTYRVDGELKEILRLKVDISKLILMRIKVLARLDTTARHPQDGVIRRSVGRMSLEARVSVLPIEQGDRLVLRLIQGGKAIPPLKELGLQAEQVTALSNLLESAQGVILVTGPVGSGKTTTLYAALQHIAEHRARTTSLVTLEDPIELRLSFAAQTQMDDRMGMSFAKTLRSVLRQDPNVLMVGEIRDTETAQIAIQAGHTGHLILTTLHVDSAARSFARLSDMGVDPAALSSAITGCVAQRLVRTLCSRCKQSAQVKPEMIKRFQIAGHPIEPHELFFSASGCEVCEGSGYAGRLPIAEILVMNPEISELLIKGAPTSSLQELAVRQGMATLATAGLLRARAGETSLDEILRVCG